METAPLDELTCEHGETDLRYKTNTMGRHVGYQCLRCGRAVGNWMPKDKIPWTAALKPWDRELEKSWLQHCQHVRSLHRARDLMAAQEASEERRAQYQARLLLPDWREEIRPAVLRRCGGICQGCGIRKAVHVHHVTYEHFGNEFLFELIGLCEECHARIHRQADLHGGPAHEQRTA